MRTVTWGLGLLGLLGTTVPGQAQELKPFELNMDRVKVAGGGRLGDSNTYLIPTVYLLMLGKGSVWVKSGGAQAHGKYFVDGLEKDWLQGLARKIQDDLVTKMRAAGYTVLTYDDIKGESKIEGKDMMDLDKKFGLPTKDVAGMTFVVSAPSDDQTFSYGITGPVWPFRGLAKDKGMVVLVPQILFTTLDMGGTTEEGYKRYSAGITIAPTMRLQGATIWGLNPKQAGVNILIDRHGTRLAAEVAGTAKQLSEDKTDFSDSWKRVSGDFSFTLDQPAVTAGVLRVSYAINDLIVAEAKKAHK